MLLAPTKGEEIIVKEIVEDPVCHMKVQATLFATEYAGSHYAFCSAQCKERFLANPRLYIGFPGRKAPAQEGKQVIICRSLLLSAPLDAIQSEQVKDALHEMMGLFEISIEGNKLEIKYDLIQVTAEQIADKLALIGAKLGGDWIDRLKLAFINNLEDIEILCRFMVRKRPSTQPIPSRLRVLQPDGYSGKKTLTCIRRRVTISEAQLRRITAWADSTNLPIATFMQLKFIAAYDHRRVICGSEV
jgi:YHS domain-containing protein